MDVKYIKVKFLKNGQPSGRTYTYRTPVDVVPGDIVQINEKSQGIVVDEPVDMEWVETYGAGKVKSIAGKAEDTKASEEATAHE